MPAIILQTICRHQQKPIWRQRAHENHACLGNICENFPLPLLNLPILPSSHPFRLHYAPLLSPCVLSSMQRRIWHSSGGDRSRAAHAAALAQSVGDLHGNMWQGRDNEVPSLLTGRLSSGVLGDLSPLSRARTARTCPSPWSPKAGVEQSQIKDGAAVAAVARTSKNQAANITAIEKILNRSLLTVARLLFNSVHS